MRGRRARWWDEGEHRRPRARPVIDPSWCRNPERRFRLMCFQRPLAPWRATREEVHQDVLAAKAGSADRRSGLFYMTVPYWIWECAPNEVTEKALERRDVPKIKRQLVEVSDFTRRWALGGQSDGRAPPGSSPR